VVGAVWVAEGLRTSTCLSQEREQRTLEAILLLPGHWGRVLRVKWLTGLIWCRWIGACLLVLWSVSALTGVLHPLAVPLLALATACHQLFITSLGLFLSQLCRTALQSSLTMACVLVALVFGLWLLLPVEMAPAQAALIPPYGFYQLAFGTEKMTVPMRL